MHLNWQEGPPSPHAAQSLPLLGSSNSRFDAGSLPAPAGLQAAPLCAPQCLLIARFMNKSALQVYEPLEGQFF